MEKIILSSEVDVKLLPRLDTLYYFVYELSRSFGADENTLASIKTGILDNQILKRVVIRYWNKEKKVVGKIIINIDWEKHFLLAKTEAGKLFELDMSKSIVENIVDWQKYIVQHTQEIRNQFNVIKIDGQFKYRDEIVKNKEEYDKALKIMGHVLAKAPIEDIDINLSKKLTDTLEKSGRLNKGNVESDLIDTISPCCGELKEVTLTICSKKNIE